MKNIMLKPILCLILILTLGGTVIGCVASAPKGDPTEVLNDYYDSIKNNNIENAYELLSEVNKTNWQKNDFIKLYQYTVQISPLKDFQVEKINEYKDKDIDGVKYKNVVEFKVTETVHTAFDDKDVNSQYKQYVVNDNGNWKVYREQKNIKESIAESMNYVAKMYYDGKGEVKDLDKAALILNEAIKVSPDYSLTYYMLGVTLLDLKRYDESISNIQKCLEKADNDSDKSDAYNILGNNYSKKKDYAKAKEYYNKAIQLNDNNQYAKTNLENLNKTTK